MISKFAMESKDDFRDKHGSSSSTVVIADDDEKVESANSCKVEKRVSGNLSFLRKWFLDHLHYPVPDLSERSELDKQINAQLKLPSDIKCPSLYWFQNARDKSTWTQFSLVYSFSKDDIMKKLVSNLQNDELNQKDKGKALEQVLTYGHDGISKQWYNQRLERRISKCQKHWNKMIDWLKQTDYNDIPLLRKIKNSNESRRFGDETLSILVKEYEQNPHYKNHLDRDRIAKLSGLKPRQVTVWFQNRRSRSENHPLRRSTKERRDRCQEEVEQGPNEESVEEQNNPSKSCKVEEEQEQETSMVTFSALQPYNEDDVVSRIDQDLLQLHTLSSAQEDSASLLPSASSSSSTQTPRSLFSPTTDATLSYLPVLSLQDIAQFNLPSSSTFVNPLWEEAWAKAHSSELEETLANWPTVQDLTETLMPEMKMTSELL